MITLDQLVYDPSNPGDGANVGSYIKAGDDGTAIGHVGDALKVDIGSVVDLDIRDLDHSQDNVAIQSGGNELGIDASGKIQSIVEATDLDIRDLSQAQDSVQAYLQDSAGNGITSTDVSGKQALDVRLAEGVNVEIDMSHVDDSVRLGDGTNLTDVTSDNRLEVFHAPDSGAQSAAALVGTSAVELASSPLANRKKIIVQNNGSKDIFLGGANTVTVSSGIRVPRGASFELDWGPNVDLWAISGAAGQDVRVMEVA